MSFPYTSEFLDKGLTYSAYRESINAMLASPPADEAAEKMRHYIQKNVILMDKYDEDYKVSDDIKGAFELVAPSTWVVITEGWCGDAAFNVPMMAAIEKAVPGKVRLLLFFRDNNLDLIDANLTEGGRSIPKLVMLNAGLQPQNSWGPRPKGLQELMKGWKNEGLQLKEIIPRVHQWYDADATESLQRELVALIKN